MSKLNKKQVLLIKELRSKGKSILEIAITLKVSSMTISYWIKRLKEAGYDVKSLVKRGSKRIEL